MIKDDQVTLDLSIQKRFHSKNYQLIKMIGQGGFGIVYKARQISTDQIVAIKFLTLSSEFDTHKRERYLERFQRETALSSRLQHPNIVRLLDKGVCDDDLVYAVFEYVDGKSLKQHLSEKGALLPVDTANLMGQVLDALSHAHDQGVIHRDLKPANIMLSSVGTKDHIKILDFGIGTLSNEVRQHDYKSITLTHETLGTPSYSAPEQLRGESPSIKSDIYVWGLVFIECLTGEPAITGNSLASIFHKQLSLSNVPIPTAVAGHPVANLLRRVLNKKMNERAGDASLIYHDLKQININSLVGDLSLKQKSATPTYLDNSDNYSKAFISSLNNLDKKVIDQSPNNAADMSSLGLQETQINTGLAINTGMIERKQISILCVTLTLKSITESMGSSDEECDLELLDVLHRDSKSQCIDIAVRYGAFHAGTLGDTLLFYFGYPAVSDNDSRLCARTALDITSNINQRNALLISSHNLEIEARMGMHAGMVSHYPDAMPEGGAINIAMELSRLSRAKQVLCSQASKRLLEGYIEFKMALNHTLGIQKGPETVHQLIGERLNEAFGFLRGTRSAHAFVGREEELEKLTNVFNDLSDNRPSYVHIHGEAGIGKSRLIYEVRGIASNFQQYMCQCLPEHKYSGLYPILSIIKNKYNLNEFESNIQNDDFERNLSRVLEKSKRVNHKKAIPLLFTWLNLPIPDSFSMSYLNIDEQKELLFNSLSILLLDDYVESSELNRPLFIVEDIHWSDPTSIEFIKHFKTCDYYKENKSIFISTSREMLQKDLIDGYEESILISGLTESKSKLFIKELLGRDSVSNSVSYEIINRTDGIPLFIEELTGMLVNKKIVHHFNGVVDFVKKKYIKEIPSTLLNSLQHKIDSLKFSKETAQLAAAIGREFDSKLLILSSIKDESKITSDLSELMQNDLIYKQRRINGDVYIFKHALVRDAVLQSKSPQQIVKNNKLIADSFVQAFPELIKENYSVIARYYSLANEYNMASYYGIEAISDYSRNSSFKEALFVGDAVLEWISKIESEKNRVEFELDFYNILLTSVVTLEGISSKKSERWSHRIKYLVGLLDCEIGSKYDSLVKRSEWIDFNILYVTGERLKSIELGEKLILENNEVEDKGYQLAIYPFLAQSYMFDGNLDKSIKYFNSALKQYDECSEINFKQLYGIDLIPYCYAVSSLTYLHLGNVDLALDKASSAVKYCNENESSALSKTISYVFNALILYMLNKESEVIEISKEYYKNHHKDESPVFYKIYLDILYQCAGGDIDVAFKMVTELSQTEQGFATAWYSNLVAKKFIKKSRYIEADSLLLSAIRLAKNDHEFSALPMVYNCLAMSKFLNGKEFTEEINNILISSVDVSNKQNASFFSDEASSYLKMMNF